jgi:hypothetical protein
MNKQISYILITILTSFLFFNSCNKNDDSNPVSSPANQFVGNWKSGAPITVKVKTDFCTNNLEDVATMEWDVSWEVTETDDPNIVNITMHYSSSNFTIINPDCNSGAGYLPEPQPIYMKGYITDNTLSVEYDNQEIFSVDYVNNKMTGELKYSYCLLYCQEIYTDENSFSVEAN